jgi:hypothetical protein
VTGSPQGGLSRGCPPFGRLVARCGEGKTDRVPPRRSVFQPLVAAVAIAAGLVLVIGVVRDLLVGDSSLWLLADAILLVASLTLLRALRRK